MYHEPLSFGLPVLPKKMLWHRFADTSLAAPDDICQPGQEKSLEVQKSYAIPERSTAILVGKYKS
jgi:glycogen operon protein